MSTSSRAAPETRQEACLSGCGALVREALNDVRRGRLKGCLGAAPDVDKTYRTLDEARRAAASLGDEVRAVAVCCPDPEDRANLHSRTSRSRGARPVRGPAVRVASKAYAPP
ncbi:hypothetical protein ACGFY9_13505 [Streptomyces sp. NPDC048504]|uniref:hypothetical protein n=1 Tax=Streptomyces sp. NPDC048504 TaxID=3365559 RepID=UPI00372254CA